MNRPKILVVDDDQVIVKAMSMKLAPAGYEIVTAADGSEAIAAARKQKPDLILLDINFPADVGVGWDAFKILAWFKRIDECKGTPVIVISGGEAAKFEARALEAGAIAYFQKPIRGDALLALIKQALAAPANAAPAPNPAS